MPLTALFAATLFVGAALLFLVQPLVGKLLLPLVGGTPAVWNTCMVFFQAVLLAGYLYAHRSAARLGVRRQAVAHLAVLAAGLLALGAAVAVAGSPLPVAASLVPADQDYPFVGVAALLAVAVGVPFFVLATTAPVLQAWFAATGHRSAADPYFLYAASNAGSLVGLLGYPLLIEPWTTLPDQQVGWAFGVCGYVALVGACFLATRNAECGMRNEEERPAADTTPAAGVEIPHSAFRIPKWVALAALPSSLLLGVTTHLSTDLAPVPLLWVVPLALYLVSFVLVFARWPDRAHRLVGRVTPMLLVFVALTLVTRAAEPLGVVGGLHLLAFFLVSLLCHGELARGRPPADRLTSFYLWMSVGGVLGGLANALAAPLLFHRVGMVEYPLALALAALVRPRRSDEPAGSRTLTRTDFTALFLLAAFAFALGRFVPLLLPPANEDDPADALVGRLLRSGLTFGLPAVVAFALVRKPARFALALGVLFLAGALDPTGIGRTLYLERNFFGVVRVTASPDGKFVRMIHGTTLHGQQHTDETGPPRPMTYYHEKGPVGRAFAALPPERLKRVAVVGLGTGAVAAYAKPGQAWTFYEIDPAVARIARDPAYFTFLSTCRADTCDVVLGDARRQLVKEPDGSLDLLVLDAFSSDAIPVHLLTCEALRLYVEKLAPGGVLLMHVSNNHLDLPPLVARLAADHAPPLAVRLDDDQTTDAEKADGKSPSQWMALARTEADLAAVAKRTTWQRVRVTPGPVWRDDFSNLLRAWKKRDE